MTPGHQSRTRPDLNKQMLPDLESTTSLQSTEKTSRLKLHYYYYYIRLTAFFQDNLVSQHQKGKPFWILL